jgi:Na+/proline symporter
MNYKTGLGLVLLIQIVISALTIFAGTGNGSFVGLGAMLLAIYGIPITLIINFFIIRKHKKNPKKSDITTVSIVSSVLPCLQLALFFAQIIFDL